MNSIEDIFLELDLYKEYSHIRINLLSAVYFGFHRSPYFPSQIIATALLESQIPSFEDFKKHLGDHRYDWRKKGTYQMIALT